MTLILGKLINKKLTKIVRNNVGPQHTTLHCSKRNRFDCRSMCIQKCTYKHSLERMDSNFRKKLDKIN